MQISDKDMRRFWKRVIKSDGCWLWMGKPNKINGYGRIYIGDVTMGAHRASYVLAYGGIPEGLLVRHTCDTPLCVRPDHLLIGTDQDNIQDQIERGRRATGERCGGAILLDIEVQQIRELYSIKYWRIVDIAKAFDVDRTTVSRIVHNRIWV